MNPVARQKMDEFHSVDEIDKALEMQDTMLSRSSDGFDLRDEYFDLWGFRSEIWETEK